MGWLPKHTLLSIPNGIAVIILHLLLASDYETGMKLVLEGWLSMYRLLPRSERSEKTFFFSLSPFSKITNNNRDVKWGGKTAQISRPFRGSDLGCWELGGKVGRVHLSWTSPLGKAESGGTEDLWKCILVLSRVANTALECVPLDVDGLAAGLFVLIHRLSWLVSKMRTDLGLDLQS